VVEVEVKEEVALELMEVWGFKLKRTTVVEMTEKAMEDEE
jgi:hypothetical protein